MKNVKNKKFNVYLLNDQYYEYLITKNKLNEKQMLTKRQRPYIGFVGIQINNRDYAIPLTSDSNNKYRNNHKYSLPLYNANNDVIGCLRINKMIPIMENENFINNIDLNYLEYDEAKRLIDELEFLNQPKIYDKVHQLANEVYERRINATEEELANDYDLKFTVDFKQAEKLMDQYILDIHKNNEKYEQQLKIYSRFYELKSLIKDYDQFKIELISENNNWNIATISLKANKENISLLKDKFDEDIYFKNNNQNVCVDLDYQEFVECSFIEDIIDELNKQEENESIWQKR